MKIKTPKMNHLTLNGIKITKNNKSCDSGEKIYAERFGTTK